MAFAFTLLALALATNTARAMPAHAGMQLRAAAPAHPTTVYATSTLRPGYFVTTTTACSYSCPSTDNSGNALIEADSCGDNCVFCRWNWPGGNHFAEYYLDSGAVSWPVGVAANPATAVITCATSTTTTTPTPTRTTVAVTSSVGPGAGIITTTTCSSVCPQYDTSGNALIENDSCGDNCIFCRWNWPGGNHFAQYYVDSGAIFSPIGVAANPPVADVACSTATSTSTSTPSRTTVFATTTPSPNVVVTTEVMCASTCPPLDNSGNALIEADSCGGNCIFCRWNWPGGNHFAQYYVDSGAVFSPIGVPANPSVAAVSCTTQAVTSTIVPTTKSTSTSSTFTPTSTSKSTVNSSSTPTPTPTPSSTTVSSTTSGASTASTSLSTSSASSASSTISATSSSSTLSSSSATSSSASTTSSSASATSSSASATSSSATSSSATSAPSSSVFATSTSSSAKTPSSSATSSSSSAASSSAASSSATSSSATLSSSSVTSSASSATSPSFSGTSSSSSGTSSSSSGTSSSSSSTSSSSSGAFSSGTSSSSSTTSVPASTLPYGFIVDMPCAVDTASRALANPEYYVLANNTPALCASTCGARGFSLSAVEYGDECFCSNSYTNDTAPAPAPAYLCNMPCAGDASQACGGGWHLQIYSSSGNPAAAAALPAGWTKTMPCVVDDINRVFANASFAQLANNTPQVCAEHCAASNFTMSGVEYMGECYCGNAWRGGVVPTPAPVSQCSMSCSGDPAQTCGGGWAIQIYGYTSA